MGRTARLEIRCFGRWIVEADGQPVGALRSRVGRELLLRLSLTSGPAAREALIDELWPENGDVRRARRRLSQELSRIREAVGVTFWDAVDDCIQVAPSLSLRSELAELQGGAGPDSVVADEEEEVRRLLALLSVPAGGTLLPGHLSEWANDRRIEVERLEVRLLRRLLSILPESGPEDGLPYARRLARLEPFDDTANAMVVRWILLGHGRAAAIDHIAEVEERYRSELGCTPSELLEAELDRPVPAPGDPLRREIDRLRSRYDRLGSSDRPERRWALLLAIDDRLRVAGRTGERSGGLRAMRDLGHDPAEVAWRQAEVALSSGDIGRCEEIVDRFEPLDPGVDAEAMLLLARCQRDELVGDRRRAGVGVWEVLAGASGTSVRIEAKLLLGHLLDRDHDYPDAEGVFLEACADAEDAGCGFSRARALCGLGWVRTGMGDYAGARQSLTLGQEESDRLGAESVGAQARGGLAHALMRDHRFGSAIREFQAAAAACARLGDDRGRLRWQANAAVSATAIGDLETAEAQQAAIRASAPTPEAVPFWMDSVYCCILELQGDLPAALERTIEAVARAAETNVPSYEWSVRMQLVQRLMDSGRLAAARAEVDLLAARVADDFGSAVWGGAVTTMAGSVLVASGDAAAGIELLRQAATTGVQDLATSCELYYWHFIAARSLGEMEEARQVAARGRQYASALRADLTDRQWQQVLAAESPLRRLTTL